MIWLLIRIPFIITILYFIVFGLKMSLYCLVGLVYTESLLKEYLNLNQYKLLVQLPTNTTARRIEKQDYL